MLIAVFLIFSLMLVFVQNDINLMQFGDRHRPYHVENAGSRPITEAKQRWARLVLGRETAWEHRVLMALFLIFFFNI